MPELPEVETVRRGLAPVMEGRRILSVDARRPDLRFPFPERFAARLKDRTVTSLGRRAKYLLADLDDGEVLVMHLGMSGSFRILLPEAEVAPGSFHHPRSKAAIHDHVEFAFEGGATVTYNDPRRFGFMTLGPRATLETHPLFRHVGIEPLGNALDGALLLRLFGTKQTSLKAALLDQRLIAGLGNIYVCEALHRAKLSPTRAAGTLTIRKANLLADAIRAVLEEAIAAGGSTLRDFAHADGALGYFQHAFRVYDREGDPCPTPGCRGVVQRIVQTGRSTFFCAQCQK
ncbi:bifunctional DNA-formamidopyrimidine glycosylase/DNA-(apurinic or apyrimidinic site) lyase [Methylopila sp. Yamaguchi]|uniref:bifunctional DNA-formamidopyrimidine glycosylase/DNA-(apurinic or apyrimidinic site) lyase n=1 Tax=Methylopila sp. Yamaguchi TaxID=1437817 RepID=UPI000CAAB1E1|nr:bifunctional DNA-formamidopyrimidine glycosylase/DNA-(apurinic or apyrimidinic site) lyase [Methylopila sp. Yamaguchi]GBD49938.1 formamidopyrimidine-DNA glycosylase [Methylopila sp. Yamaguchi]